ncbi:MAG: glycerophosphodiester phosphodiesterase family protein [Chitinophagaceae bacterium]
MMKKYPFYFTGFVWLLLIFQNNYAAPSFFSVQTFTSPNAKTNSSVTVGSMVHLNYRSLFLYNADLSGGIIGDVSTGGSITVSVYAYNSDASNGKGSLVYGVILNSSSSSFSGSYWTTGPYAWGQTVKSTEIQKLAQVARVYVDPNGQSSVCGLSKVERTIYGLFTLGLTEAAAASGGGCVQTPSLQPVIVEVTLLNATLKKIKIPGLGEANAATVFPDMPLMPINSKVMLGSHRGDWQDVNAPENTKNSIRDMIAEGYDMVELDLWDTSDDSVIVFHDMGLNKRTSQTGSVKARTWSSISGLYIKNRFDELISTSDTKMELLRNILRYIRTKDPGGKVLLNLDRSANDMTMFKMVYKVISEEGMLDRAVFKGRFDPTPASTTGPTVANIRQAFTDMFPTLTQAERDDRMKRMRFTPILFDNNKNTVTTNDAAFAQTVKQYIDDMVTAGIADGFELNYKSYPVGAADFANASDDNVFLLKNWSVLGNTNFVQYVHSKKLPVGIFASVPEVCAIPDFNETTGARIATKLVSGFVKEDTDPLTLTYVPYVKDQSMYDFRGDWDFYIPAGADYVITDRPDALREYLKAIGRFK